ncbi:carboxypeptidase-like regulatory domain-containing protein [Nonlabens agnitus]|uniref:TonB-dependent receptor n=1 Tax=Nonlabens agnitus TaxID=870484 RepID=A0A2S9WVC4_9FLAO|nr:carboxypeptidase-like regulatory domain-containing protein [Nonlabens agnitus]PRP67419.1 hypothetical protein BST86_10110 [Nonlabens agnitus]
MPLQQNSIFHQVILVFFLSFFTITQVSAQEQLIEGKVVDAITKEPLMGVGVYLSGTSTGVVTALDGSYSIKYDQEMKAPLVFAYLGYETRTFVNPLQEDLKLVLLAQQENELEAVVINPDPWDRATKEGLFLDHFLGLRSLEDSEILNLKDVRLRFNTDSKQLTASSRNPIIIVNKHLGYRIKYDLIEFEINFRFFKPTQGIERRFEIEHARENYRVESSFVSGSSFYQELEKDRPSERRRNRRREKAFEISQLLFFRSLINKSLSENKFELYHKGFRVNPEDHYRVREENGLYKITFRHLNYSVRDRDGHQTDLTLHDHFIYVDSFGNNLSARELMLSGYLPQLGVGGMLPLDYNTNSDE